MQKVIDTVMYLFHLQQQVYPVSHDSWLKEKEQWPIF